MEKKYVQKVIPCVSTERYRKMTSYALRKEILRMCNLYQGRIICNEHVGIPIQISGYRRKTAYGEAVYSKKAAVVEQLEVLLRVARYNNFGEPKAGDPSNVIGYYNFRAYIIIDEKRECVRLAIIARKDGSFYYNLEVNMQK